MRKTHAFVAGILSGLVLTVGPLPASAQDLPSWFVRGEIGAASIHAGSFGLESDLDDLRGSGRVGRALGRSGLFALDLGVVR